MAVLHSYWNSLKSKLLNISANFLHFLPPKSANFKNFYSKRANFVKVFPEKFKSKLF